MLGHTVQCLLDLVLVGSQQAAPICPGGVTWPAQGCTPAPVLPGQEARMTGAVKAFW